MLDADARIGRREPVREVAGAVGRAVVDDEQHGAGERVEDRRRDPGQVLGLVVGRQDDPGARAQRGLRGVRGGLRGVRRGLRAARTFLGLGRRGRRLGRRSGSIVIVAPSSSGRECTGRSRGLRTRPGPTASTGSGGRRCRGRRSAIVAVPAAPACTLNVATYEPSVRRVAVTTFVGPAGLLERDRGLRPEGLDRRERHPQRLAGLQPRGGGRRGERARPDGADRGRPCPGTTRPSGAPRTGPAGRRRRSRAGRSTPTGGRPRAGSLPGPHGPDERPGRVVQAERRLRVAGELPGQASSSARAGRRPADRSCATSGGSPPCGPRPRRASLHAGCRRRRRGRRAARSGRRRRACRPRFARPSSWPTPDTECTVHERTTVPPLQDPNGAAAALVGGPRQAASRPGRRRRSGDSRPGAAAVEMTGRRRVDDDRERAPGLVAGRVHHAQRGRVAAVGDARAAVPLAAPGERDRTAAAVGGPDGAGRARRRGGPSASRRTRSSPGAPRRGCRRRWARSGSSTPRRP